MKKTQVNLNSFWDFCKGLNLVLGLKGLTEPRRFIKSNGLIFQFIFLMCVLGKSSFLKMDQHGRFKKIKKLFKILRFVNSRLRHTVVSDSTMIERLAEMDEKEVIHINYHVLKAGLRRGLILRIAIVDGTQLGGKLYSCLCFITRWGDVLMVDKEPIEQRGKELISSERLICRCFENLGEERIEYLLADMLYFNERFWKLQEQGYIGELLIKYTPDPSQQLEKPYRIILQRFEELVALYNQEEKSKSDREKLYRMGFECVTGEDKGKDLTYQIYSCRNNSFDNRYKVAKVVECKLKSGEERFFYVITTDKTLPSKEMREFAHDRWYIENDGFKMLNAHLQSKRIWSKNDTVLSNLISIWMLAYSLITLYRREYGHCIRKKYHQVKVTINFVIQIFEQESFGKLYMQGI